jgi:predicted deacetylase
VAYVLPGIVSVGAYTLGVPWALVGYIASASAVAMSLWWMNKSLNAMAAAHAPGYSFILSTLKVLEEKAKHQRERMFWRWTRRAA